MQQNCFLSLQCCLQTCDNSYLPLVLPTADAVMPAEALVLKGSLAPAHLLVALVLEANCFKALTGILIDNKCNYCNILILKLS